MTPPVANGSAFSLPLVGQVVDFDTCLSIISCSFARTMNSSSFQARLTTASLHSTPARCSRSLKGQCKGQYKGTDLMRLQALSFTKTVRHPNSSISPNRMLNAHFIVKTMPFLIFHRCLTQRYSVLAPSNFHGHDFSCTETC